MERAKGAPTGFQCEAGDASTVSSAWITIARASARYALSGVRGIPRAKGTAARADGLVTEFERVAAVEDIMTEARSPRIGLMARYESATPKAGSAGTRAQSVFVEGSECLCRRRALHRVGCARPSLSRPSLTIPGHLGSLTAANWVSFDFNVS